MAETSVVARPGTRDSHGVGRKLIDLSMPVHNASVRKYGVTHLTASYLVVLGDHTGTHMDSSSKTVTLEQTEFPVAAGWC
jgi:hypothetical protein